jgi:hypothetical protein
MRDSFGSRRLIFKNTEETRSSLPSVCGSALDVQVASGVLARHRVMGIWVMDCVFARPEHRLSEEAQALRSSNL